MALTERARIREIMFVQDDNTLQWHAHQQPITEILSDGVVVSAQYGGAQPITVEGAGAVLDEALITIVNQRDDLQAQLTTAYARIAELEASGAT